jgi:hypothetical protein
VNPEDVNAQFWAHEEAARLVDDAANSIVFAQRKLENALRALDGVMSLYTGDTGLDSTYARAQVANMADQLEALNLDDLADEVRSARR